MYLRWYLTSLVKHPQIGSFSRCRLRAQHRLTTSTVEAMQCAGGFVQMVNME
jgi:hypothetical protein